MLKSPGNEVGISIEFDVRYESVSIHLLFLAMALMGHPETEVITVVPAT